jgi:hypothetical protein
METSTSETPKSIMGTPTSETPKSIYWTRHAESCANLLENKIVDVYKDKDIQTQHSDLFATHAVKSRYFDNVGNVKQSDGSYPSDIGTILSSISKNIPNKKAVFSKPIFKGADSRWLFHPPLSSIGIQQAEKLNKQEKFTEVVKECNVFVTSATVRTIMTAIYSLNGIKSVTLYVVPYINEQMNEASLFGLDFVNIGIPKDKIDEIIKCVIKYVKSRVKTGDETRVETEDKTEVKTGDETGHQFSIGTITIDTSFYHNCETLPTTITTITNDPTSVLESSIKKFKETIIPQLSEHTGVKVEEMIILAFSHGYVINKLLGSHGSEYPKTVRFAPNVSMFKEDDTANTMDVVVVDEDNAPNGGVFVRNPSKKLITDDDNYDKQDEDEDDMSPCSLYGLRGDVNKILLTDDYIKGQGQLKLQEVLESMDLEAQILGYGGGSTRKHKKYRTRRNLSKHRKQTKRPRRANRIRKSRRGVKK